MRGEWVKIQKPLQRKYTIFYNKPKNDNFGCISFFRERIVESNLIINKLRTQKVNYLVFRRSFSETSDFRVAKYSYR